MLNYMLLFQSKIVFKNKFVTVLKYKSKTFQFMYLSAI